MKVFREKTLIEFSCGLLCALSVIIELLSFRIVSCLSTVGCILGSNKESSGRAWNRQDNVGWSV